MLSGENMCHVQDCNLCVLKHPSNPFMVVTTTMPFCEVCRLSHKLRNGTFIKKEKKKKSISIIFFLPLHSPLPEPIRLLTPIPTAIKIKTLPITRLPHYRKTFGLPFGCDGTSSESVVRIYCTK